MFIEMSRPCLQPQRGGIGAKTLTNCLIDHVMSLGALFFLSGRCYKHGAPSGARGDRFLNSTAVGLG